LGENKLISDEEKARIISQVRFENLIRKELKNEEQKETKPTRWSWLHSKLGLLLIGALISGFLVPLFQYTYETIKWTRQNRYDNIKYRLEMVRSGIKEMALVQSFIAEAYERTRPLFKSKVLDPKTVNLYRSKMIEMHNRRFFQNAKLFSYLSYFTEKQQKVINFYFEKYLSSVQAYMALLDTMIISGDEMSMNAKGEKIDFGKKINLLIKQINEDYDEIMSIMQLYLKELEDESEQFM
jgi:hypothetical protein